MVQAVGIRTPYEAVPATVRAWVERELGSVVTSATTQYGGFSPGTAARLVTASGRRAFVKAVGLELNPGTPDLFRNEIRVMTAVDPLPMAPKLYATYDDGDWVALLLEDIDGRLPVFPWRADDAHRVLDAVDEMSEALDPSPWPDAPAAAERSREFLTRWSAILDDGTTLPDWAAARADQLAQIASTAIEALARGKALAHWDVRSDNILITKDRVVFVDWAWACRAPAWADRVFIEGEIRASVELPDLPDDPGITAFLVAFAGGLWWGSFQPPPPNLPTMRTWQRAHAQRYFDWVRRRLGW